jgi:predicted GTPase
LHRKHRRAALVTQRTMNTAYRARILIMGVAGRDFHNFSVVYRDDPAFELDRFLAARAAG